MPPPSKLAVATSSVLRLVKEEASYHKELLQQEARIPQLEQNIGEDNGEYMLKQQHQAIAETKNVFPTVRQKIADALELLEERLEANKEEGGPASTEDVTKAKEAVAAAKKAIREIS